MSSTYPADSAAVSCGENGATTVFIVLSAITFAVATAFVPTRLYIRVKLLKTVWWDDIAICIAYLILVAYFGILWRMTDRGLGRNVDCVSYADIKNFLELQPVSQFLQIMCTMFARISVAMFVGRLFGVTKKFRIFLYGYTAFMTVSMLVTAILTFCVCSPVDMYWHVFPGRISYCQSMTGVTFTNYYNGSVGALSDLLLALLPAYFLYHLHMDWKNRLNLSVLMAVGLIPCGCCLARMVLWETVNGAQPLESFASILLFGSLEASMLIICAIVPTLKPIFLSAERKRKLSHESNWGFKGFNKEKHILGRAGTTLSRAVSRRFSPNEVRVLREWSVTSEARQSSLAAYPTRSEVDGTRSSKESLSSSDG